MIRGSAAIAARTYQAGMGVGFADEQPWQEILASDARGGRLRGYWLECRGEPIAFQIGTILEKTYFMDFMGYLPEYASLGAGSVLHGRVLQDLARTACAGSITALVTRTTRRPTAQNRERKRRWSSTAAGRKRGRHAPWRAGPTG